MATRDSGLADIGTAAARVRGLTRAFDGRTVLDGVDLDIAPGEKHDLKSELRRRVTLNEARKAWIAELALPMKSLTERFDPAATWRVNFYRVEGPSEPRFYSAWQPTGTPAPNFHVPEAFGKLIFADSAAAK